MRKLVSKIFEVDFAYKLSIHIEMNVDYYLFLIVN